MFRPVNIHGLYVETDWVSHFYHTQICKNALLSPVGFTLGYRRRKPKTNMYCMQTLYIDRPAGKRQK